MRSLTDKEYKTLQELASDHNIKLYGYQTNGGYIILNNSKNNNIGGKTLDEIKESIRSS